MATNLHLVSPPGRGISRQFYRSTLASPRSCLLFCSSRKDYDAPKAVVRMHRKMNALGGDGIHDSCLSSVVLALAPYRYDASRGVELRKEVDRLVDFIRRSARTVGKSFPSPSTPRFSNHVCIVTSCLRCACAFDLWMPTALKQQTIIPARAPGQPCAEPQRQLNPKRVGIRGTPKILDL